MYDSKADTLQHIKRVNELLLDVVTSLLHRAVTHDSSKLSPIEKETFDLYTPLLKDTTYGSDDYNRYLAGMEKALKHHYDNNPHHPEHHENGIDGMSLIDIMEMLVDWKAASERHADGDIFESIKINEKRFKLSNQVINILLNTADAMGWDDEE